MGTVYLHPPLPTVRQALMVQSKQTPSAVTQNRHQMRRWRREADMGDLKWVKYRPFIKNWRLFRLSVWNYLKLLPVEPLHLTSHFSADNCVEFFLHRTVSNTISNDFILSLSFCFLFFFFVYVFTGYNSSINICWTMCMSRLWVPKIMELRKVLFCT